LDNTFAPLSGENILKMYECEEGCSRCCGPKSFIALTDNRVISRQEPLNCCCCCWKSAHVDTAIFLQDIEVIQEYKGETTDLCRALILACISCTLPCFLFGLCCGSCCGDTPKYISVKGGFGAETLTFNATEAVDAANEISAMVQPLKNRR
jgi:hypothetical protein